MGRQSRNPKRVATALDKSRNLPFVGSIKRRGEPPASVRTEFSLGLPRTIPRCGRTFVSDLPCRSDTLRFEIVRIHRRRSEQRSLCGLHYWDKVIQIESIPARPDTFQSVMKDFVGDFVDLIVEGGEITGKSLRLKMMNMPTAVPADLDQHLAPYGKHLSRKIVPLQLRKPLLKTDAKVTKQKAQRAHFTVPASSVSHCTSADDTLSRFSSPCND